MHGSNDSKQFLLRRSSILLASLGWLTLAAACSTLASDAGEDENYSDSDGFTRGDSSDSDAEAGTAAESDTEGGEPELDLPGEDGGGDCEEECSPWDPSSCDEGLKCTPVTCEDGEYPVDTFSCRPVAGEGQAGDECEPFAEGGDNCDAGFFCWEVDDATGQGHCEPLCVGTPETPDCEAGRVCAMFGGAGLSLCVPTCDPLSIECPASDATCLPVLDAGEFACLPNNADGAGEYGDSCEFSNACAPGLMCVEPSLVPEPSCEGAAGCCTEFCALGQEESCSGLGQICVPMQDVVGNASFETQVGVCVFEQLPNDANPAG
jgi:hypothetical protein